MENLLACPNCGASVISKDEKIVINQQVAVKCDYCGSEWIPGQINPQQANIKVTASAVHSGPSFVKTADEVAAPITASKTEKKVAKVISLTVSIICGVMAVLCLLLSFSLGMTGIWMALFFAVPSFIFWRLSRYN